MTGTSVDQVDDPMRAQPSELEASAMAQRGQMQLLLIWSVGTRASTSGEMTTPRHQQGGCASPPVGSDSMAHWFDCPQIGHKPGEAFIGEAE